MSRRIGFDRERRARELADELEQRRTTHDAHVRAWERWLLSTNGARPYGRHGWVIYGAATMTPEEAVARIRTNTTRRTP